MIPSSSIVSALPWLVAAGLVAAWTVTVVAVLIYLIVRAVLCKTDPRSLPEVLRALTPLLSVVARALGRLPIGSSTDKEMPSEQTGNSSIDPGEDES